MVRVLYTKQDTCSAAPRAVVGLVLRSWLPLSHEYHRCDHSLNIEVIVMRERQGLSSRVVVGVQVEV